MLRYIAIPLHRVWVGPSFPEDFASPSPEATHGALWRWCRSVTATASGIVDGLVDNLNDQKYGLLITITSATNTPSGGWTVFTNYYADGEGFDVSGGQVTGVNIVLYANDRPQKLYLGNQDEYNPFLVTPFPIEISNEDVNNTTSNSLMFTPASSVSVPGPLPLFGAAAAFGWRRQLRRRIKTSG
ncbi:MAG: hypothetical protein NTZ40_13490 [Cyanobacteria bacterium]|nr:hypothetical protein [Cyanobacteriota bacterium]